MATVAKGPEESGVESLLLGFSDSRAAFYDRSET